MIENRDYVVCVDKSGSMSIDDCNGKTRWQSCQESVLGLLNKLQEIDPDGVDLYFYNTRFEKHENVTAEKLNEVWNKITPIGGTAFSPVLIDVFKQHFSKQARPTTILFITDGEAYDKPETVQEIISAANKLEADAELAVTFIQVGKDAGAKEFLRKLDDDLQSKGAKFDIVDAKTMEDLENTSLEQILLDAIND